MRQGLHLAAWRTGDSTKIESLLMGMAWLAVPIGGDTAGLGKG